ncbi:MAG: hypothetical protein ACI959_001398 [Limisphaerales bacterium]|jgi:hypothetical protein
MRTYTAFLFFAILAVVLPITAQQQFVSPALDNPSFENNSEPYCPTVPSEAQLSWLRNFQQNLERTNLEVLSNARRAGGADYYIPVQVHIIGNDDGKGYLRHQLFLDAICKLNDDFASAGFHFYLNLPLDYIDNTDYHDQDFSAGGAMIIGNNVPGAVNLYYVYQIGEGTIAGYFSPGADGLVMAQSASAPGSNTLPHEFGHFFSLPHTFFRWEYGTPSPSQQEWVDGSNCSTAADGFCDTPPDYAPFRWTCPMVGPFTDPDGASFTVTDSFFMSYAGNSCRDRFSPEQDAAMRGYLTGVHPDLIGSSNPYFPNGYDSVKLATPLDNETEVLPIGGLFSWSTVPDAVAYHVSIGFTSIFSAIIDEAIVTDTFWYATDLIEDRLFYWKVKPLFEGNTCEPYTDSRIFRTGINPPPATGLEEFELENDVQIFPHPVIASSTANIELNLKEAGNYNFEWLDVSGRSIQSFNTELSAGAQNLTIEIPSVDQGLYLLKLTSESGALIRKVLIAEN